MTNASRPDQAANTNSQTDSGLPACLRDFVGAWQLSRSIVQGNGDTFLFDGTANFIWRDTDVLYQESGQVTAPGGNVLLAERCYYWRQPSESQFDVLFDDHRYFHSFSPARPYAEHLCGDDHYRVHYTFAQWPAWESRWRVTGPRKDYTMLSRYTPG